MKKILTTLAAFALTLPVWAQGLAPATVPFFPLYFDTTCSGLAYEDGETLINNEVCRVLAVFNWTAGHSFELDVDGNPVELDADGNPVTGAIFKWMTTGTPPQDYAPITGGITGTSVSTTLRLVQFFLSDIPTGYEMAYYDVYFITQDTRVPEGEEKRLVKWNATSIGRFGPMPSMQKFAMNFTESPYTSPVQSKNWKYPYGVEPEPEIVFPDDTSEDVKVAAIEALEAALGEDAAAVTEITNPEVAAEINGIITGRGTVELDETGTIATFTYDFKVSEITFGESGVTVKVELGENQAFATGVTVTLVDLDGNPIGLVENGEATITKESGTQLFKVKATKADQTNEESVDPEE